MAYHDGYDDDDQYGDEDYGDHTYDSDDCDERDAYDDYCNRDEESDDQESYDERDDYDQYDDNNDLYHDEEDCYEDEEDAQPRRHSEYTPEPPSATIKQEILKAMEKENVHPDDIPPEPAPHFPANVSSSKRYFDTKKGFAWFSCPSKHHRWPSAHASCYLDLKKQEIRYRFEQECKKCNKEAPPEFSLKAVERMATFAVRMYLKLIGKKVEGSAATGEGPVPKDGKPHDEARCGKCKYLGRSCWKY